jgi:hypothetical protein
MAPRFVAASLAVLFLVAGCASPPHFEDPFARAQIAWRPALVLDAGDAGRILGATSHLDRVTSYLEGGTRTFQATFVDDTLAPAAGRTGALGYMYEEYQTSEAARSYLDTTLKENRLSPSAAVRIDGTELHYFTGGDIVRMVMILKGNHLVRLKVNPVPARYSLAEFRAVVGELARRL